MLLAIKSFREVMQPKILGGSLKNVERAHKKFFIPGVPKYHPKFGILAQARVKKLDQLDFTCIYFGQKSKKYFSQNSQPDSQKQKNIVHDTHQAQKYRNCEFFRALFLVRISGIIFLNEVLKYNNLVRISTMIFLGLAQNILVRNSAINFIGILRA